MEAQELFLKEGKSAGVWFCSSCRRVDYSQEYAEACCKPKNCEYCGEEVKEKYYEACSSCISRRQTEKEEKTLAEAEVVEYKGEPVFTYHVSGLQDGFFYDMGSLLEYCYDDEIEPPEKVFICDEESFTGINVENAVEAAVSEMYEDAYDDIEGWDILQKANEEFIDANVGMKSWNPVYTKVAMVPKENALETEVGGNEV